MGSWAAGARRLASAVVGIASISVLTTCDLDKLLTKADTAGPGSTALDSTDLALTGGTEVTLGGTITMAVTSPSADLSQTVKRWVSAAPTIIAIDSVTGIATGLAIGTAKITARVLAPELDVGVTRSQDVRVRYKSIRVTAPTVTDSITGLGLTRSIVVQGRNNAGALVTALASPTLTSSDTTIFRVSGSTIVARKNGSARIIAVFDSLRDSVLFKVRQVAKSITFPTTDYSATTMFMGLAVPLTAKDVADSTIATPTATWRVNDTTVATVGAATGVLWLKKYDTTRVFAKVDTVERGQKIVVAQVVTSLSKLAGSDAQTDTVALPLAAAPAVTALDAGGSAVRYTSVTFRVGSGGGRITDSVKTTDVSGRATLGSWTLGAVAGPNTVVATSGGATTTFTATGVAGAPARLAFAAQPAYVAVSAVIAPAVKVAVQDSLGNTATTATASVTLTLGNNPSGATLGGTITVAAVAGIATFSDLTVSAGRGGYTLNASSGALTSAISNGFDIYGVATNLFFESGPSNVTTGAVITPAVRVAVRDADGAGVVTATNTVTLSLSTNPGVATLGGTVSAAAVAGTATFSNLTLNQLGTGYRLRAFATGLIPDTSDAFNVVAVGLAAKLAFTIQPSNVVAGASVSPAIQVTVQDASGVTVTSSSATITLAIDATANPGSSTISGGSTVTAVASSGVATFSTATLNKAGTGYRLTVSATSLTAATSNTFNVTPGTATKLAFVQQPSHSMFSQTMTPPVTVAIQDANSNTVTTQAATSISLALGTCSATLAGTTTASSSSGVATFSALSVATQVSNCTITAAATGLTSATSSAFNIVSATGAVKLGFITNPPTSTAAGSSLGTIQVALQDASGATVTSGSAVTVTLSIGTNPGSGSLTGTLSASTSNGVATFTANTIAKSGTGYTLSATATGYQIGTSSAFNITPGTASKLGFLQQPTTSSAGVPFAPEVQIAIQDASGNTVTTSSASVNLQFSTGFGTGSFDGASSTTVTAVNGIARFVGLRVKQAYTGYTLWAYSGTLSSVYSSSFNVVKAPVVLGFSTQPTSASAAGSTISATVQTQDSVGNLYTDPSAAITVSLTGGTAGAVLSGTTTVTPVSGSAAFTNLSVDKPGTLYQLNASASGFATNASSTFAVTPGSATKLAWIDQPQATFVNAPLNPSGQLPRIAVQDAQGNTVTSNNFTTIRLGVGVGPTSSFKSSGSSVTTFDMSTTNGIVTIPSSITMSTPASNYQLAAATTGFLTLTGANSDSFVVAAFDVKSKLGFVQGPSTATYTVSITPAVTVAVQDQYGNTITTATDAISIAIGRDANAPTTLSGGGTVAAVNGVATFTGLSLNKTGTGYTLAASATGLASGTSGPFSVNPFVPTQLVVLVQPGPSIVGQPITPAPQVAIQDAAGNTVTTATNTVTASQSGGVGTLSGTLSVAAVSGVATFADLRVSAAGSPQLRFASSPLTGLFLSTSFTLTSLPAPTSLVATSLTATQINLSWTDNATNEDGFRIERCTGASCSTFTEIATVGANVTTYLNTGLTAETSYSYRVRAYTSVGNSGYAGPATFTTAPNPPAAPSGLTATAVSPTQIDLAWTDNATNETGFKIERCQGVSCSSFSEVATLAANVTTHQQTGLTAGTSFSYRVRAYNAGGNSANSATASATTPVPPPPSAPSGLTATAISAAQISLAWTDNASNEDGFRISRCSGVSCSTFAVIDSVAANVTSYQNTGLTAATSYTYQVLAYNAGGSSSSATASATTPTNLIANGSFTSGSAFWTFSGSAFATTSGPNYYTSPGYAHLGTDVNEVGVSNAIGSAYQDVSIPAGASAASLKFQLNVTTSEFPSSTQWDKLIVYVTNTSNVIQATLATYSNVDAAAGAGSAYYGLKSLSLTPYIGQTVRILFYCTSDSSFPTIFRIDDVVVTAP